MSEYFVCAKDCVFANQRWYPGDKMPAMYSKDGVCPKHFLDPQGYAAKKAEEAEAKHNEEVKNRMDSIRTDDPLIKGMTQDILNKTLGKKKVVLKRPLSDGWKDEQNKKAEIPPVAGPQPGSLIPEKRGPGRPPKIQEAD
jgi:hypothetical protein